MNDRIPIRGESSRRNNRDNKIQVPAVFLPKLELGLQQRRKDAKTSAAWKWPIHGGHALRILTDLDWTFQRSGAEKFLSSSRDSDGLWHREPSTEVAGLFSAGVCA